jgi:hypothetical protein
MFRSNTVRALAALTLLAAPVSIAAPPAPGVSPPEVNDIEINDTFDQRIVIPGSDACKWGTNIDGRLGDYNALQPDTDLCVITFEFCNSNDDGGPFATWGGSALFFLRPGIGSPGNWFPVPIRVAGKGFYSRFTSTHSERGPVEVYIRFYDSGGVFISQEVRRGVLLGTNDELLWDIPVPGNTFDFDVIVNPLASENGDVDYYEVTDLRPNVDYRVRVVSGLHDRDTLFGLPRPLDTILGQFSSSGTLQATNDDICNSVGCGAWNPRSQLVIRSDAAGRIRFALTGYDDFNFNGIQDSTSGFARNAAHDETGQYSIRIEHVCALGCVDNNGDCIVNFTDLNAVLSRFGDSCP